MKDNFDRGVDIFFGVCILTLIILKLTGIIKVSWLILLAPLWGLFLLGIFLAILLTLMCFINMWINDRKKEKDNERY